MAGDDEKPKKSWREIDQAKDKSSHRREGGGGGGGSGRGIERTQAYRSYKTQLNKLFDGGVLPDALKDKLEEKGIGTDAKQKKALTRDLVAATTPEAIKAALEAYRAATQGFPDDEEALGKLLELEDVAVVLETLSTLDRLHGAGGLKRASSLKARIKTAQMTVDSAKVTEAARALLAKL
jgi:hypothetical protein